MTQTRRFNFSNNRGYRPFNNRPRFNRGNFQRPKSKLGNNINLFIKKASDDTLPQKYTPQNSFEGFNLSAQLLQNILHQGFTSPTPIQDQAIKPILEGRDFIGLAKTGTGKTAAFLIPILNRIFKSSSLQRQGSNNEIDLMDSRVRGNDRVEGKKAIIITPTRELALQINEELHSLSYGMHIYSALIIGGSNMHRQVQDLRKNPQVVIGTPGRMKDLIERRQLNISDFNIVVLDEVDLMVDIGFITDVKYFISFLPNIRQSLFFSATISSKVREVLSIFVHDPITVEVKATDSPENIDQDIVRVVNKERKVDQLHDLLIKDGFDKVLIFGRTKRGIEKLNRELVLRGFKVGALHGNKSQGHRQRTLGSFKRNEIQVLLATDVASRGLDIDNVTHVINYDLPETYEGYIHRIGRTGRAGKAGRALTFIE